MAGIKITNQEIVEYLSFVKLSINTKCYPRQLSCGERQRTAIACVLCKQPDLIIADEPTSALDSVNSNIIMDIFRHISSIKNKKVIIATHNNKIYEQTDTIYEIKDQKIALLKNNG